MKCSFVGRLPLVPAHLTASGVARVECGRSVEHCAPWMRGEQPPVSFPPKTPDAPATPGSAVGQTGKCVGTLRATL